jgi:hypothetical protein
MGIRRRPRRAALVALAVVVPAALTGCATEYHGYDSGIDDVLWRQVAAFEDPLMSGIHAPLDPVIAALHESRPREYPAPVTDPAQYLAGIEGARWDGEAASVAQLPIDDGGVVLYDITTGDRTAVFSVFIASGLGPGASAEGAGWFSAPAEVYTCYRMAVDLAAAHDEPSVARTEFSECPDALVSRLAESAAFASAEVFDG